MRQAAITLAISIALSFAWVHLFNYKPQTVYWTTETFQDAEGDTITATRCSNSPPPNPLDK